MSAPVSVRYDVTGSDRVASETRKISKELDALRTSQGGVVSSVKQMEAGFRTDALGGFSTAVTNADTRVTGLRAKLSQFGGTLAQNATSFGVATASIWGIYNAYDSLEKVQIRANAAAQRVSTLETTIATLTERRRQAVEKGNMSAEQMAILDERITNAHGKLAVAQQRNSDLQQDVNESWAAFASQVGPQTIAAGASIVQLVTNMRGSMGGVIPSIRNFFGSFTGGSQVMAQTRQQSLLLGQGIGNLPGPMGAATVATRGLSNAMRGLLIGTGVGAAIAVIGLIAEQFLNTAEATDTSTQDIEDSLGEMNDSFSGSEGAVKQWGGTVHQMIDGTVVVVKDAASQIKESLTSMAKELRSEFPGLTPEFIAGKNVENEQEIARLQQRRAGLLSGGVKPQSPFRNVDQEVASLDAQIKKLNKDIEDNKNLMNLMFGIASKGASDLDTLGASASDAAGKVRELTNVGADLTQLFHIWQSGGFEKTGLDRVRFLYDLHKKGLLDYTAGEKTAITTTEQLNIANENAQTVLKAKAAAFLESFNAANQESEAEKEKERIEKENLNTMKMLTTQTFGVAQATQQAGESNADYTTRMELLSSITLDQINNEKQHSLALIQTAVDLGINTTRQAELSAAIFEGDAAVTQLILSGQTLVDVLTNTDRTMDLVNTGMVEGRTSVIEFNDALTQQIATDEQVMADLEILAALYGVDLPQGIALTQEQLKDLITEFRTTGSTAVTENAIMEEAFGSAREGLEELINAAAEGGDKFRDAWKDFPKQFIPKGEKDEVEEFTEDMGELMTAVDEAATQMATFQEMMALGLIDEEEMGKWTKEIAEGLRKIRSELSDIVGEDIAKNLVDPFIELRENGLSEADVNAITAFEAKFKELSKGGITDTELKILQDYSKELLEAAKAAERLKPFRESGVFDTGMDVEQIFEDQESTDKPEKPGPAPVIAADTTAFDASIAHVDAEVARIDALAPIVDIMGDHSSSGNFMVAAGDVATMVEAIDALAPIVDFMGDHSKSGNFMKAATDVAKVVEEIDALAPIVDFMGDHSSSGNFMDVASDVEDKIDEIDGTVVNVEFHAFRTGNWSKSAQHGMHEVLAEDTVILAHKGEKVDIGPSGPPPISFGNSMPSSSGGGGKGLTVLHVEMPVYIGSQMLTKIIKDIPLSDTGMFPSA